MGYTRCIAGMITNEEPDMIRNLLVGTAMGLVTALVVAQPGDRNDNSIVLGGSNPSLEAGALALLSGDYDEGIRLTLDGLDDRSISQENRASGLSNLCAGYAAKQLADTAIRYCTESLAVRRGNWRAFSNRSYAYWIKGMYSEAQFDLDAASALSPRARQIAQIRGMINEARLVPNIVMEDLQ
jgi:tetratricopeptide (TPR) repeat protein